MATVCALIGVENKIEFMGGSLGSGMPRWWAGAGATCSPQRLCQKRLGQKRLWEEAVSSRSSAVEPVGHHQAPAARLQRRQGPHAR
eukprot:COSAG01_NODE_4477_length_4987_cov_42.965630_7_plen_86_part_00